MWLIKKDLKRLISFILIRIYQEYIGYLKGCKLKYDLRYPFKDNPQQDLEKSDWYKNKLLEATRDEDAVNPPEVEAILGRFDDE